MRPTNAVSVSSSGSAHGKGTKVQWLIDFPVVLHNHGVRISQADVYKGVEAAMALIGAELQTVLDLASGYVRDASPAMRARDDALKRLQDALREVLAAMPVAAGRPRLDVAVGGRQGSYSPLAWVRIYSPEHSPLATTGLYLAYLFAADGSRVYLSLQQGSSEIRSGHMRPVNDPGELLSRGTAARSAIRDLIDSPLGAGMSMGIDLGWRRLSSVGSYSKHRIGNYEHANILAVVYDSGGIPSDSTLAADLYRGVVLLSALYGDTELADSAGPPLSGSAMPDASGPSANRAQELLREAEIRRAIEIHAEDGAESYFRSLGWSFQRVGPQHLGYDLDCENAEGARLHVEVKGTQGLGEEVFLTRNEAVHNGTQSECDAQHALYVLSRVEVSSTGAIKCIGGVPRCIHPWAADHAGLVPTLYAYRVPPHGSK
jgi:MrcB-like, N-terminal domain/Domain of unknown function (DUF3883)